MSVVGGDTMAPRRWNPRRPAEPHWFCRSARRRVLLRGHALPGRSHGVRRRSTRKSTCAVAATAPTNGKAARAPVVAEAKLPVEALNGSPMRTGADCLPAKSCLRKTVAVCLPAKSCLRKKSTAGHPDPERCVSFRGMVDVAEYARLLGGSGAVASDGSGVSLGLGVKRRSLKEKLSPEAPGFAPFRRRGVAAAAKKRAAKPEFEMVPLAKRMRLLKNSMGIAAFKAAWSKSRPEFLRLRASRVQSNSNITAADMMPRSLQLARTRALGVAKEVQEWSKLVQRGSAIGVAAARPAGGVASSRRQPRRGQLRQSPEAP